MNTVTLLASEWVFLTLCAGYTLSKGDSVEVIAELGPRMIEEARGKLTQTASGTATKLKNSTFEITRV
jgi:hypothetical protein